MDPKGLGSPGRDNPGTGASPVCLWLLLKETAGGGGSRSAGGESSGGMEAEKEWEESRNLIPWGLSLLTAAPAAQIPHPGAAGAGTTRGGVWREGDLEGWDLVGWDLEGWDLEGGGSQT